MSIAVEAEKEVSTKSWPEGIYDLFKANDITLVAVVPDAGHSKLIQLCEADDEITLVSLTTEEEGIPLLAGGYLGGKKGALLMQSSGAGNCINMLSLPLNYSFPCLMLITLRGDHGEFNPMQVPMGNNAQSVLEAMGVIVRRADRPEDVVETVNSALGFAFNGYKPTAALIGQAVIGTKNFLK
ncbi:sulfopyruvate decarboxylase, alpha subunit [Arthrobacter sp. yr096]|uniref:phosphonopyruvate decarboxylase n=1 Tax=Arthrobacter sp. yr096 TaxID=1761750 RepID=UPI0008C0FBDA|nr:phosphonopyruvate decarboxylase [Arthrobacter sp. yr096]SEJ78104.1 sulfopyruvate decarboxylase, alpha subunit [Arthrobacter sp. yr096]